MLYETESPYQYISVVRLDDGARVLELNEGVAYHSMWRRDSVLTGQYWDVFLLLPPLLGREPRELLVIGNAGGTISRAYGRFYPSVSIDGVELDSKVTAAGRRFLGLGDNPRLRVITADGRPFLQRSRKRYDLIVVDAYRQPYVPFYLATREFFTLAREHLEPGGMLAVNVAKVPGDARLTRGDRDDPPRRLPRSLGLACLRFQRFRVCPGPAGAAEDARPTRDGGTRATPHAHPALSPSTRRCPTAWRCANRRSRPRRVAHRQDVADPDRAGRGARRALTSDCTLIRGGSHRFDMMVPRLRAGLR